METNYTEVTELAGDEVSQEQVERLCHRYYWAGNYCRDKDVLEAACGTGQGLGYLASLSRSLKAGDISEEILGRARAHYGNRVDLRLFDTQATPFPDRSLDVILLFEAIYYIPSAVKFAAECRRLLRPGGKVLLATANKDLYDFNPSPFTYEYFGVVELEQLFSHQGFSVECWGAFPVDEASARQRILRPIKALAAKLHLIPKSMKGKKLLKRFVFGKLVRMPAEVAGGMCRYEAPVLLPKGAPDRTHKVVYGMATLAS